MEDNMNSCSLSLSELHDIEANQNLEQALLRALQKKGMPVKGTFLLKPDPNYLYTSISYFDDLVLWFTWEKK